MRGFPDNSRAVRSARNGSAVRGQLVGGRPQVIGLVAAKRGILERYGVGTHGSGGPRQAKVHGHPIIPWERVVRVGSKVIVRD
jgi:hypothetical protein